MKADNHVWMAHSGPSNATPEALARGQTDDPGVHHVSERLVVRRGRGKRTRGYQPQPVVSGAPLALGGAETLLIRDDFLRVYSSVPALPTIQGRAA